MKTIGRFEIRRELGRGAQSIVYLAWDPQLEREVAIKTLYFARRDAAHNATLLAEARAVGRLRHPNIVPIFDAGEEDGDPYLVFEYVEGRSLADLLKSDGALPPARAADLMRQVLDAIADAHAHGIIHRDLKPSNILLDVRGTPRVMDFGIASRVEAGGSEEGQGLTGTPAYMAPEYVSRKEVSEKVDVFAAGLVLLEMLTGRRAITGDSVPQVLYKIACEPVALPRDPPLEDRMADIVARAVASDPAQRYPAVAAMREALVRYLDVGSGGEGEGGQSTLDFLLRRMRHKTDFPALSDSVSAINRLTHSDKESINKLSNTILKDYALTNKILRLVNSAFYRQVGGGSISTVSRAVIVLGFDAIRNIALTVLLFEHLQDKANARELKEGFLRANLAALLARDAGHKLIARESEEVFVCALFHSLGAQLAQYYFPEEAEQMRKLMQQKGLDENAAAIQVLGISLEELGIGIARHWGFPQSIVNAMRRLSDGPQKKPQTREEGLRMLAGFSNELCDLIGSVPAAQRAKALREKMSRFSACMPFDDNQVREMVRKAVEELGQLANILHLNLRQSPFARAAQSFAGIASEKADSAAAAGWTTLENTVLAEPMLPDADGASGADVQAVLAAGIQDISNSLVEDFKLNDILRIILETMYRAMGFEHVLLCLKDVKSGMMSGRFGFGADVSELAKIFRYPLAFEPDVFHAATSKGVDIIITDIDDPRIADRIPAWYRQKVAAKTFVLFPLTIKGNPVALIYCDKSRAGSIVIPERELSLLRTLRNQAVLAIKQST